MTYSALQTNAPYLKQVLRDNFTTAVRSRGKYLHEGGAVQNLIIEDEVVFSQVMGSALYVVQFDFVKGAIRHGSCTCPFEGFCKHMVATIHRLIELDGRERPMGVNANVEISQKKWYADQYRPLPKADEVPTYEMLVALKPHRLRWNSYLTIEHYLASADLIESVISGDYSWRQEEVQKVTLRRQGGHVEVRCQACAMHSQRLCPHQYRVLEDLSRSLIGLAWMEHRHDCEADIREMAEKHQMSVENFTSAFAILIGEGRYEIEPKIEGVLMHMASTDLTAMLYDGLGVPKVLGSEDRLQQIERELTFQNAFVWFHMLDRQRGGLFTIIEGRANRDRTKLTAYIKEVDQPRYLAAPELELYKRLSDACRQATRQVDQAAQVLPILQAEGALLSDVLHYRYPYEFLRHYNVEIRKKDLQAFRFQEARADVRISARVENDLYVIEATMIIGDQKVDFDELSFYNHVLVCDQRNKGYLLADEAAGKALRFFREKSKLLFFLDERAKFLSFLQQLRKHFQVEIDLPFVKEKIVYKVKKKIYLKELNNHLLFEPVISHDEVQFRDLDPLVTQTAKGHMTVYRLPPGVMHDFLEQLRSLHPSWSDRDASKPFALPTGALMKDFWFLNFYDKCRELGIEVFGQEDLSKFKYSPHRATVSTRIKSNIDWFDLEVEIKFGEETLAAKDWLSAIQNKTRYVLLSDGSIGVLPQAWVEKLEKLSKAVVVEQNDLKISKLGFNLVDELFEERDFDAQVRAEVEERKKKLRAFSEQAEYALPTALTATLRNYQEAGFQWLKFLQQFGFGGCLADDMGLGKTLQAICVLADRDGDSQEPSLVVAPRTLLFNWAAELEKFCPDLTYAIYHGPGRAKIYKELDRQDVVISTYDTIASDIKKFTDRQWRYVILDESQAIKNPSSKRYKAMCLLQAKHRLVMTGTPIENSTFDLYAQMSFANPGLLGNMTSFKRNYVTPIERHGDEKTSELLQKLIHPFVLRRTKGQVAQDLPEKTESVLYCEMESDQRRQYEALRQQLRKQIKEKIAREGVAKSKFMVLEGLLRLRQMCNSPLLLDEALDSPQAKSVKLDMLVERLNEELADHHVLVFSQFVGMLKLIRERLDETSIPYAYLDGSTRDREQAVREFTDEDDRQVFLLSLKAANTGLNLIKADYVFLVDPWWNPAVEAQAIDRTHRIGQDKHIFAYKMICKDTIEEKILDLQQKKKKLAGDLIQTDANVFKSLKKDELIALFD